MIKKISSKVVIENPFFNYCEDEVEFPGKKPGTFYYLDHGKSVFVIPVLKDGNFLMVDQYRYMPNFRGLEFPAGNVEKDESHEDAAKRELLEETGGIGKHVHELGTFFPLSVAMKTDHKVFIAMVEERQAFQADDDEILEPMVVSPEELDKYIFEQRVKDGPTLVLYMLLQNYMKQTYNNMVTTDSMKFLYNELMNGNI